MNNKNIGKLSLSGYVELITAMATLNGSTPEEVNYDYFVWYGVVSEERFEEAKMALGIRKAVESYYTI